MRYGIAFVLVLIVTLSVWLIWPSIFPVEPLDRPIDSAQDNTTTPGTSGVPVTETPAELGEVGTDDYNEGKTLPGGPAQLTGQLLPETPDITVSGLELELRKLDDTELIRNYTQSDSSGAFNFDNLAVGPYILQLTTPGYALKKVPTPISLSEDTVAPRLTLTVIHGGGFSGRVFDAETDTGIDGVLLAALQPGEYELLKTNYNTKTDEDGTYTISGLPPGSYAVQYDQVKGYPSNIVNIKNQRIVNVKAGEVHTGIDIALDKGLTIEGIVVDVDGVPLKDADVSVYTVGMYQSFTTDSSGTFVLGGFQANTSVTANVYLSDYWMESIEALPIPSRGIKDLILTMEKTASLAGVVVTPAGAPFPGARVLIRTDATDESVIQARSNIQGDGVFYEDFRQADANGHFSAEQLRAGTYSLGVLMPGEHTSVETALLTVKLLPGEQRENLRLVYDGDLRLVVQGRVLSPEREPLPDTSINLQQFESNFYEYGMSDSEGRFAMYGPAEGTFDLEAHHMDYGMASLKGLHSGSKDIELVLEDGITLSGQVLDAVTREPVIAYALQPMYGKQDDYMGEFSIVNNTYLSSEPHQMVLDAEGRFHFDNFRRDYQTLLVRAEGYSDNWYAVNNLSSATSEIDDIEIFLEKGTTLAGRVIDARRRPVAAALIFSGSYVIDSTSQALAFSDEEGKFELNNLSAGTYTIGATHPDHAPGNSSVIVGHAATDNIEIVLGQPGTIEGRVTVGRQPAAQAQLHFSTAPLDTEQAPGIQFYTAAVTDSQGHYRFEGLPEGAGNVYCWITTGNRNQNREIIVTAGRVTTQNFEFEIANAEIFGAVHMPTWPDKLEGNIQVEVDTNGDVEHFWANLQATGQYHLENLPSGIATVTLMMYDQDNMQSSSQYRNVTLQQGQSHQVDFVIESAGSLQLWVTGLPETTEYVNIMLLEGIYAPPADQDDLYTNYMDAQRSQVFGVPREVYQFNNIQPGDYTVIGLAALRQEPGREIVDYSELQILTSSVITIPDGVEITEATLAF